MIEVKTKFPFANSISEFSRNQDPKRTFDLNGIQNLPSRNGSGFSDLFLSLAGRRACLISGVPSSKMDY
jgi:hypothetical protein